MGELAADHSRQPTVRNPRWADRRSAHEARHADPSEAGGKLQEHPRVIGVHALGHDLAGLDEIDRVEGRARHRGHRALLDLVLDHGDAGHDQAGAAPRPLDVIVDAARVVRPVGVAEAPGADRLHHIAVFDLQFPDSGRGKEDFVLLVHDRRPSPRRTAGFARRSGAFSARDDQSRFRRIAARPRDMGPLTSGVRVTRAGAGRHAA